MNTDMKFGPVHFISGQNKGRYPHCHSIYIEDAGVVIDPSSDRVRLSEMRDKGAIQIIWLTHWHEDHIMDLDLFYELPLWLGKQDAPPLADIEVFLDWYDMTNPDFRGIFRQSMLEEFHYKPKKANRLLEDGEQIDFGNVSVEVIHTPGHTPGHLSFFFKEPAVLLLGDYDLTPFGPWYGDRFSSVEQTISSVKRLRDIPAKIWLTSHETGVFEDDPGILWDNYRQVIQTREDKLLDFLKTHRTMEEIVNAWFIYGRAREPREFFEFGERANMGKHLERLMNKGIVGHEEDRYYLIR